MSIKSLLSAPMGKVYVYLADVKIGKRFLMDAENEGFTFGDGIKPTMKEPDYIIAVNNDMTINYVGFIGRVAFQAANEIGNQKLRKIDYRDILNHTE